MVYLSLLLWVVWNDVTINILTTLAKHLGMTRLQFLGVGRVVTHKVVLQGKARGKHPVIYSPCLQVF